jgi:hypothetical protein
MDREEEFDNNTFVEPIIPFLRIYISIGQENHDMLEIEEIATFLTSDNKSINETIKDLLDRGIVNVYACSFGEVAKVF